jgi:hypothetical protein
MTLDRCPSSIVCPLGTCSRSCPCRCDEWKFVEPTNPESITTLQIFLLEPGIRKTPKHQDGNASLTTVRPWCFANPSTENQTLNRKAQTVPPSQIVQYHLPPLSKPHVAVELIFPHETLHPLPSDKGLTFKCATFV